MQHPQFLKTGDKVAFVSTARKCTAEDLAFARQVVESWGLKVALGKTIGPEQHQFAGDDTLRTQDLQQMLDDPEIKAVFCAKGGYGTVRIIDNLNFVRFMKDPKWIVGYSDVNVIHSHLQQNFKMQSIHGPLLFQFEKTTPDALESLRNILFEGTFELSWNSEKPNKTGHANGILVGGNLSVLYSLSNSVSDINTDGKILFIEDLDEYLYHIDRMLMQLKRAGKFDKLKGLIVGGMTDMRDNTVPFGEEALEMIERITAAYDFPVAYNCPAGHVDNNYSLLMGAEIHLECSQYNANISNKNT